MPFLPSSEPQPAALQNRWLQRFWPWLILFCLLITAVWEYRVFDRGFDSEYPTLVRNTYNPLPPAVYRLAEPGDTLDRAALYAAAAGFVASLNGWWMSWKKNRSSALWPVAAALLLAAGWHAATPWPTFDGWYGWNWYSLSDPALPTSTRLTLSAFLFALIAWSLGWIFAARKNLRRYLATAWRHRSLGLMVIGGIGIFWRMAHLPDGEPTGYWSGWGFGMGLIAIGIGLLRVVPAWPETSWGRIALTGSWIAASLALCVAGRAVIWYHRPLERLRPIVPGKIYLSAMPRYRGLEIAHERHGFRTIIDVFNENTDQRSPYLEDEIRFAREHQIRFLAAPGDTAQSNAFLDETLRVAQDPNAWPILVHCHGSMDRSPAWMGIYRFLVQKRPLREILMEIERHRGSRPKALVTLLYNRVLPARAPEQFQADPTAQELRRNAQGSDDPFVAEYLPEPPGASHPPNSFTLETTAPGQARESGSTLTETAR